ncbi:hypothetical protein H9Y04_44495 [Streptomyces sp. TRM66268-LWL]|uniref:Lipoprotein n=1 Tax=Streptomyces polyasparticus TaxID=2767826 RepID=A0ABR7SVM8_9ACTN|nr:hypothetical protein [Streptomyces polyasparticus]MBC9719569.1 hypothetical protein [Streptomyces polyasparticus]
MRVPMKLLVAVPLVSLALAACGSQGEDSSVASAGGDKQQSGKQLSSAEKLRKYKACLAERGVSAQAHKVGEEAPEQVSPEEMEEALEECKEWAPTAEDVAGSKPDEKTLEAVRKYAQCLRDNGVNVPDPDPETGALSSSKDMMKDPDKLKAAAEKCKHLAPGAQQ